MALVMILIGITTAGISNASHHARKTSREIVRAHLQQARAHAISSRNLTAIVIPAGGPTGLRAISMIEVEKVDVRYVPLKNEIGETGLLQSWTKLPKNFHFVSEEMIHTGQFTVLDQGATMTIRDRGRELECHMLVFAPHGHIIFPKSGEPIHIAMAQAAGRPDTLRISQISEGKPVFDLFQVNRLTAKAQIISP